MNKAALIIFQKNAILGKVKTRLAVSIGEEKALEVYQWLTEYTHDQVRDLKVDKFLFYSDFIPDHSPGDFLGYQFELQSGNSLGDRMSNAFAFLFAKGYKSVVIIGTDCPDLQSKDLNRAFMNLSQADLVIGPAKDGGYYLIGMSMFIPEIFKDIPWSTSKVLDSTLERANSLKIDYEFLHVLSDIDTFQDWENFKKRTNSTHE